MIFRLTLELELVAENDREHLAFVFLNPKTCPAVKLILVDGQRITHGAICENEHIISIYYMRKIEFIKSS